MGGTVAEHRLSKPIRRLAEISAALCLIPGKLNRLTKVLTESEAAENLCAELVPSAVKSVTCVGSGKPTSACLRPKRMCSVLIGFGYLFHTVDSPVSHPGFGLTPAGKQSLFARPAIAGIRLTSVVRSLCAA